MTTFRANVPDAFEDRMAVLFMNTYDQEPDNYTQWCNVVPWTQGHVDAWKISGLANFAQKVEGTPVAMDDPVQGPRRRSIIGTFARGTSATMEAIEDDQWQVIDQMPKDLAHGGKDHLERLVAALINTAEVTTNFTGLDGLAIASAVHPNLKTGTLQSNVLVPGVALSTSGLETAFTQLRRTLNDQDQQTPIRPEMLLIPVDLEHEAARLLESQFEPGTNENQENVMRSSRTGVKPVSSPYFTDLDRWVLTGAKSKHHLTYRNRKSLTMRPPSTDPRTFDRLVTAHYRGRPDCFEYRGTEFSIP